MHPDRIASKAIARTAVLQSVSKPIRGSSCEVETQDREPERSQKRLFQRWRCSDFWHSADARLPNLQRLNRQRWRRPSCTSISTRASRSNPVCTSARPLTNRYAAPTTMARPNVSESGPRAASSSRVVSETNRGATRGGLTPYRFQGSMPRSFTLRKEQK